MPESFMDNFHNLIFLQWSFTLGTHYDHRATRGGKVEQRSSFSRLMVDRVRSHARGSHVNLGGFEKNEKRQGRMLLRSSL